MSFTRKLLALGLLLTIGPLLVISAVVRHNGQLTAAAAHDSTVRLAQDDLDHIVQLVFLASEAASGADENSRAAAVEHLLSRLATLKVGRTGYVYILSATGEHRGSYELSLNRTRDGENIWESRDANGRVFIQEIIGKAVALGPADVAELRYPWKNAGDPVPVMKVARFKFVPALNWVVAASLPEPELLATSHAIDALVARSNLTLIIVTVLALLICPLVWWLFSRRLGAALHAIVVELMSGSEQVVRAANQVSHSAQELSRGATEEASSIVQTSQSMDQMAQMTHGTAENSRTAEALMTDVDARVRESNAALSEMVSSMSLIQQSSEKVGRIIRTIDEIAFQTNILALNAAVEAARAGEAGLGFAVVAGEVRSLAQRSAQAAKDTASLIEESLENSRRGATKVDQVAAAITAITHGVDKVKGIVEAVSTASVQQAERIDSVSKAVALIENVTRTTAAEAEESAAASEELSAQAQTAMCTIERLEALVGAHHRPADTSATSKPAERRAPVVSLAGRRSSRTMARESGADDLLQRTGT